MLRGVAVADSQNVSEAGGQGADKSGVLKTCLDLGGQRRGDLGMCSRS